MDNHEIKVDRRVLKTKKAIRNAFAELLAQKDINEITVKDIADAADINRKTFYNNYSGIYQIVDELENEIVTALTDIIGDIDLRRDLKNPYNIFAKLTEVINNDLDFYGHLMKADSNSKLTAKIAAALQEKIKESFSSKAAVDPLTLDIMTEYTMSGMLAVYKRWFNSSRDQSIDDISKIVSVLAVSGLNGIWEAEG